MTKLVVLLSILVSSLAFGGEKLKFSILVETRLKIPVENEVLINGNKNRISYILDVGVYQCPSKLPEEIKELSNMFFKEKNRLRNEGRDFGYGNERLRKAFRQKFHFLCDKSFESGWSARCEQDEISEHIAMAEAYLKQNKVKKQKPKIIQVSVSEITSSANTTLVWTNINCND